MAGTNMAYVVVMHRIRMPDGTISSHHRSTLLHVAGRFPTCLHACCSCVWVSFQHALDTLAATMPP